MYIQNHVYVITKTYNKVIFYRFLEQLDLLLLNNGIKRKFEHFLRLTISDILKWQNQGDEKYKKDSNGCPILACQSGIILIFA